MKITSHVRTQRLRLRAGSLELEVPFSAVSAAENSKPGIKNQKKSRVFSRPEAGAELNLIGWRVEEALCELDKFLDSSLLHGLGEIRVIHGIGSGNLLRGVREYLARCPHVESFRPGENFEGGEGVTVVKMMS